MKHKIFLGLGSNIGDRLGYLEAAIASLPPAVEVLRRSAIYETAPWGYQDQADFLNMVIEAETELAPQELLKELKAIETKVGRKPTFRNGPREIDIDILLYGNEAISLRGVTIPHSRLQERAFVLVPLADLAPLLMLPGQKQTVSEILHKLDTSGVHAFNKQAPKET